MVELRVKVGRKGQVLIPKVLRDKYGVKEGEAVRIETREDGVLVRGRPSAQDVLRILAEHVDRVKALRAKSLKPGDLKARYLEVEFEERQA